MLAQSSDWAFIMKTNTVVDYAVRRTKEHLHRFFALAEQLRMGQVDEEYVARLERRNNLLPFIDYRNYRDAPAQPVAVGQGAGASQHSRQTWGREGDRA